MKLYIMMSVVCSGVILSANPFSLQENLKNLNEDQNDLFMELKSVQEQKEISKSQKKEPAIVESEPQKIPSAKQNNKIQTPPQEESEIEVTLTPISKETPSKTNKQIPEIPNLSTTIKTPQSKHDIPKIPIVTQKPQEPKDKKELAKAEEERERNKKEALISQLLDEKHKEESSAKAEKEKKKKEALEAKIAQKKREQEALAQREELAKAEKEKKKKEALEAKIAQKKREQEALVKAEEKKQNESYQKSESTQKKATPSQTTRKVVLPIQKDMLDDKEVYVSEEEKNKKRLLQQEQKVKDDADKAYLKAIQAVDTE